MEQLFFSAVLSMVTVTGGCMVLMVGMLIATRSRHPAMATARTLELQPLMPEPPPAQVEPILEEIEAEVPEEELLVLEPKMVKDEPPAAISANLLPHDSDNIIIEPNYEREAKPMRQVMYETPIERPAVPKGALIIEADDDSFEELFKSAPAFPALSALPRRGQSERDRRLSKRLDALTTERQPVKPLPMPIAPPNLEPIPELEPTELMIRRPDWAQDWP